MDCFSNEGIAERMRVVERLEIGRYDSGSPNKEGAAFPLLKICGNLRDSKVLGELIYERNLGIAKCY